VTGLEPAASGVTGQRSNQLSYTPCALRGRGLGRLHSPVKAQTLIPAGFFIPFKPKKKVVYLKGGMVGDDRLELPTLSV